MWKEKAYKIVFGLFIIMFLLIIHIFVININRTNNEVLENNTYTEETEGFRRNDNSVNEFQEQVDRSLTNNEGNNEIGKLNELTNPLMFYDFDKEYQAQKQKRQEFLKEILSAENLLNQEAKMKEIFPKQDKKENDEIFMKILIPLENGCGFDNFGCIDKGEVIQKNSLLKNYHGFIFPNYEYLQAEYGKYLSPEMQEYLSLQEQSMKERRFGKKDDTQCLNLLDCKKWATQWSEFKTKYPDFIGIKQVDKWYQWNRFWLDVKSVSNKKSNSQ